MKVNPDKFYVASRFHRHEKVRTIVEWANTARKDSRYGTQAHRIKCLVLKNYKVTKDFIPLCDEWEDKPWNFCHWLANAARGYRITLIPGSTEYSPSTIRMHHV